MSSNININEILNIIPHRYPFILVDKIIEHIPDEKMVGVKNVTINEPYFQGHFPGKPVMPGVLILEAMGQTGAVLAMTSVFNEQKDHILYLAGVDKVRFRKPVVPGDQLILDLRLLNMRKHVIKMSGIAMVDEKIVAEAELLAVLDKK